MKQLSCMIGTFMFIMFFSTASVAGTVGQLNKKHFDESLSLQDANWTINILNWYIVADANAGFAPNHIFNRSDTTYKWYKLLGIPSSMPWHAGLMLDFGIPVAKSSLHLAGGLRYCDRFYYYPRNQTYAGNNMMLSLGFKIGTGTNIPIWGITMDVGAWNHPDNAASTETSAGAIYVNIHWNKFNRKTGEKNFETGIKAYFLSLDFLDDALNVVEGFYDIYLAYRRPRAFYSSALKRYGYLSVGASIGGSASGPSIMELTGTEDNDWSPRIDIGF